MTFAQMLSEIEYQAHSGPSPLDLDEGDAYRLFAAMLDGGVPDLELGALLTALRMKAEGLPELLGFQRAVNERLYRLAMPIREYRPVVIPTYGGGRERPNLLPLLVLLLQRFGIPVLVHGTLEGHGRVATAYILRELGIMPSASLALAQEALQENLVAFVPTAALTPGLAHLLSLRARLGMRNIAHTMVRLLDPFHGEGVRLVGADGPPEQGVLREVLVSSGQRALLLEGTDGEAFANPARRPRIEHVAGGRVATLFEAELGPIKAVPGLPLSVDAGATARWIVAALAGETPLPHPIVNQLACCLYAAGYTDDMNQAKAIVAVESCSLVPIGDAGR